MIGLRIATWNVQKKPTEMSTGGKKRKKIANASGDDIAKAQCIARMVVRPDRDPMSWEDIEPPPGPDPRIDLLALQEFPGDAEFRDQLQQELDRLTTEGEYAITEPMRSTPDPQSGESKLSYWTQEPQFDSHTLTHGGGQLDWYVLIYRSSRFASVFPGDECVKYLGKQVKLEIPTDSRPLPKEEELKNLDVKYLRTIDVSEVSVVAGDHSEFRSMERFIFADLELSRDPVDGGLSDLAAYPAGKRPAKIRRRNNSNSEFNPGRENVRRELACLTDRRPFYIKMKAATGGPTFHVYNFHAPFKNKGIDPPWAMQAFAAYGFRDAVNADLQSKGAAKDGGDTILFLGDFNLNEFGVRSNLVDRLSEDLRKGWLHEHSHVAKAKRYDHILVRTVSDKWQVSLKRVPYWEGLALDKAEKAKMGATGLAEQMESRKVGGLKEKAGKVYKFETGKERGFLSDHLWVVADLELEETSLVGAKRKRGPAR